MIKRFLLNAHHIRKISGKSIIAQICEVLILRLSRVKLRAYEYYNFGLYDDRLYSFKNKIAFVGISVEGRLNELLNDRQWHAIANDKLIFYSILKGVDLPIPTIYALFHSHGRYFDGAPCFTDRKDLANFIRNEINIPFFSKPVYGAFGMGSIGVTAYEKRLDKLLLFDGTEVSVEDYIAEITSKFGMQHIFQEFLLPNLELEEICNYRIPTLRLIILRSKQRPILIRSILMIPAGTTMLDDTRQEHSANLVGMVNRDNGIIERVIKHRNAEISEAFHENDIQKFLIGKKIPDWDELVNLCKRASTVFPGLRLQHWDVAISSKGPIILEINALGRLGIAQAASRAGIYDEEFRSYIVPLEL